jgi:FkbM family methyltransferase
MNKRTIHTITINGLRLSFVNKEEFAITYEDIFRAHACRFTATTSTPFIIDGGAHIGLSVLYFKERYPHARILAFEPHPETFALLTSNVVQNQLTGVELVNAALAENTGQMDYYVSAQKTDEFSTWSWGFTGVKDARPESKNTMTITVPAVQLSMYLAQHPHVDFLKLDVKGMETLVMQDIADQLGGVQELRVDFHSSTTNLSNRLETLLSLLEQQGLQWTLKQGGAAVSLSRMKLTDPYWVTIYAHRQRQYLWWQTEVRLPLNRAYRAVRTIWMNRYILPSQLGGHKTKGGAS